MSTLVVYPAVNPVITEEAGTRGGTHSGMDLAAERGDPVLAAFDGEVIFVGGDGASGWLPLGGGKFVKANGEGRTVEIRRADGLISRVGHLEGYAVKVGDRVKAGQVVGFAGDSGFSLGVHIHWETRRDRAWSGGRWINPRSLNPVIFKAVLVKKKGGVIARNRKDDDVIFIYLANAFGKYKHNYALLVLGKPGSWEEFSGQDSANQMAEQRGPAMAVSKTKWDRLKEKYS